ncbi:MAG: HAD-IC family P-type ATPase, partial [Acetatifactor sp.]|nr:HAD-IC family P-type ATPase [Acetatifactor sp.]
AYSLEQKSEHPLARAIRQKAQQEGLTAEEVSDFKALPGNGLTASLESAVLYGGSYKFISEQVPVSAEMETRSDQFSQEGKTPLLFARDGALCGIIAVADVIKEDSPRAIREMQNMGIHVVMLTGDNERTARAIGAQAGVDEVIAGVMPDGKESVIRRLKEKGKVIMVGDGINDAPALTSADIGIAIGAGTDVAIDAADVVLMKSRLSDVPAAIRLSRATLRNIHENLFWAFIYNIIGIPLAAGVFIRVLGLQLNPMFGAAAMSLSSFCVVTNALRLNFFKMHDSSRDHSIKKDRIKNASNKDDLAKDGFNKKGSNKNDTIKQDSVKNQKEKETKSMEKTLKIEGMMCGHCEAHVKKALEALEGVGQADVSHEAGTAVVTLTGDISEDVLRQTVVDQGYKVTEIQ